MANIEINSQHRTPMELGSNMHALISYRAIVAGVLIAMFVMTGLIGLGLAVGGMKMGEETTVQAAGFFSGVWFIVSALVALFIGSYFAARVSKFRTGRIGSVQGLAIAALFIGFFFYVTFSFLGGAGSTFGSLLGRSSGVITTGNQDTAVAAIIPDTIGDLAQDGLGELNLKSSPQVVAGRLGSRIVRGDTEGAKNYLALEAGITPEEADLRITQMKDNINQYLMNAKVSAAEALRSTGWTLFLLVAFGALAAVGGGSLGSVANYRRPLIRETDERYPPGQTV